MIKRTMTAGAILGMALFSSLACSAGSAERGATKAVTCSACHGADGNSVNPQWPSLAGLGADYIAGQLKNFKDGKRASPMMMPMVTNLSADDMADIAAYFASLPNKGLEADPTYWQAGQKLFRSGDTTRAIPACMACHGPAGYGVPAAQFPALRGQHSVYVIKQLQDYASGARTTGPNNIMQEIAKKLSADDMRNVASYLQGIR
jgi:cytochrome c553